MQNDGARPAVPYPFFRPVCAPCNRPFQFYPIRQYAVHRPKPHGVPSPGSCTQCDEVRRNRIIAWSFALPACMARRPRRMHHIQGRQRHGTPLAQVVASFCLYSCHWGALPGDGAGITGDSVDKHTQTLTQSMQFIDAAHSPAHATRAQPTQGAIPPQTPCHTPSLDVGRPSTQGNNTAAAGARSRARAWRPTPYDHACAVGIRLLLGTPAGQDGGPA